MPTIYYCDYAAGNDSTGDGSAGNPYKTIDKASTGLSGGDEVRCAKSAAPTGLGGTLTFTNGSTSVATSVDMTGSLAAKDFVGLNTAGETWWEISSITSTTITLISKYVGTGGTGTGYKLGVTDTGAAAGSSTVVQQVSASGSSGNLIKISGGWNLAGTPTQDGQTWFWQSGTNKYGYGLQLSSKSYIELDFGRVGFLRYNRAICLSSSSNNTITSATCNSNSGYGIYLSSSSNNTITSATCNSNSNYGIYLSSSNNNTITSATCNSNSYGIYLTSSNNNTITSATCNSNSGYGICLSSSNNNTITSATCNSSSIGIYLTSSSNNTITSATCNSNSGYGICLSSSNNNTITSATCNSNSNYGIYLNAGSSCVCWNYAHDESTWDNAGKIGEWSGNKQKIVSVKESESGGAARNRVYFYGGYTQDNTAEADGGSGKCLQFNPKSATYWIEQDFQVPVTASTARTVSIKMKDDASFNGNVYLELWYLGELIAGPTEKTMTTSYASQEMTATAGQITVDGVLTLKVKVYGTAGDVYADTLSYT